MAKRWRIYPLTKEDQAGANQRQFKAEDLDRPGTVVTIRVSQRDGDRGFDRLLESDGALDIEFDDPVERKK
jgi:hypothetical protein